eukprot:1047054-Pelagomonas_calceolata.AAC.6
MSSTATYFSHARPRGFGYTLQNHKFAKASNCLLRRGHVVLINVSSYVALKTLVIARLSVAGHVVPKLNWSCPSDATWVNPLSSLACTNADQVKDAVAYFGGTAMINRGAVQ